MESSKNLVKTEIKTSEKNKIILENIVKMVTNRTGIFKPENLEENIKSLHDQINENMEFNIKSDYDDTVISIKFYYQKLTTIRKIVPIEEFLVKNKNNHKIIILNSFNLKVYKQFMEYPKIELFFDHELMINLIDNCLIPEHKVLTPDEVEEYKNTYIHPVSTNNSEIKGMSRMFVTDPIARYYNMIAGDIVKILRPSMTSGYSIFYRKVYHGTNLLFPTK